jgi:pilin isopeptide linkage protein
VTNDANGGITFHLTFTAAGTYTYTVYQVTGSDAQITYDTSTFTLTYTVTDTDGVLSLQEDTQRVYFSNTHTPAPIVVNIDGIVTLDGAALTVGQFTFVLREGNTTLGQTTNAADGSIRFTQTLPAAGTYTYTITQQAIANPEMGLLQDLDPIQVIVTVIDQNGQLSATQEYSRQEKPVCTLEFWNIYEDLYATASIYGSVSLNDVTSNSIMSPATNRFRIGLYQDGKLVSEIGNGSDGWFYFPELIFRQVGTYHYTVRQIPGSESWIQYDTREYSVVITVTFEYGDPMAVMDMYDSSGQYMQMLDFINNYTPPAQTYTFTIPNSPGSGYAIYTYDETGMQSGTATARPGMIVEFYVIVPTSTTEINLQVTCNIPGVIVQQVYRYGNEIRFQLVMPAQDVLPENIILTVI